MTARLTFEVAGTPVPQGSHRLIGNRVIPDKRLVAWRQLVTAEALYAAETQGWDEPWDGPCVVRATFWLPRPSTVTRRYPTTVHENSGDIDKLARAVLDALAPKAHDQRVLTNDARVVELHAAKHYATPDRPAGVHVQIGTIE